jgi:hypothetical protein
MGTSNSRDFEDELTIENYQKKNIPNEIQDYINELNKEDIQLVKK